MELRYIHTIQIPQTKGEFFPIIQLDGEVIDIASRNECHSGSKKLHPVVHLHIFNQKGELFLQKRADTKDIQPGKWDTAVGGHVDYGESISQALHREAFEELGITFENAIFLFDYPFESDREKEYVNTFALYKEDGFKLDPVEISEGRFWSLDEIEANLDKAIFTPNFMGEYALLKAYMHNKKVE